MSSLRLVNPHPAEHEECYDCGAQHGEQCVAVFVEGDFPDFRYGPPMLYPHPTRVSRWESREPIAEADA